MTLTATIKRATLLAAIATGISACDSLKITGEPLNLGAAQDGVQNLLNHGDFDGGFGDWRACSDPSFVTLSTDDANTISTAQLDANGCIYQAVPAKANDNMMFTCSARKSTNKWASISFGYLDENYQPLKTVEEQIPGNNFSDVTASLRAPANTAFAEVLIYTEDGAAVDNCELINTEAGAPAELISNPLFEEGLDGWQTCSRGSVSVANDSATLNSSCISQKFTAHEGLELSATCNANGDGNTHSALALGYLDENFQSLAMDEIPLDNNNGYTSINLVAPPATRYAQVMVYTEGTANVTGCSMNIPSND